MLAKLISGALYNERTRHVGFFNLDIKISRDTGLPLVMEVSNGMRGLYRPVDDRHETPIPTKLWQWLASKAPTYFCTRFDPAGDPGHWQAYNNYYDLEYMGSLPGNKLGTIQDFFTLFSAGQFAPPSLAQEQGLVINHDLAGQEFSATMVHDYPELIFVNGIGAMNKIVADKTSSLKLFQQAGLSDVIPAQVVIPKALALVSTEAILEHIAGLPGERFIIKPALSRNGIGIMSFTRKAAAKFFARFSKACLQYAGQPFPRLNAKDQFYYDEPLRYWARPDVQDIIIQEFIAGQEYVLAGDVFEPTIRVAVGLDVNTLAGTESATCLGGYFYLPPKPIGTGSWAEQYISNQYRTAGSVQGWHRALDAQALDTMQGFLSEQFLVFYRQLLLADAEAYMQITSGPQQ